jgi:hypothetical protein
MTDNLLLDNNPGIDFLVLESRISNALTTNRAILIEDSAQSNFNLSIVQLLSLKEEAFIAACFCTILGRNADKTSLNHYLEKLHNGSDKRVIIASLRFSKEGKLRFKNNDHQLPKLTQYRILCLPIIGKIVIKTLPLYHSIKYFLS